MPHPTPSGRPERIPRTPLTHLFAAAGPALAAPAGPPPLPAEVRDLAGAESLAAVDYYLASRARAEAAYDLAESDPDRGERPRTKWGHVVQADATAAESRLIRAVLAWDPGIAGDSMCAAEKSIQRPRGLIAGGMLYLAMVARDRQDLEVGTRPKGYDGMEMVELHSIPLASIVDLDREGGER